MMGDQRCWKCRPESVCDLTLPCTQVESIRAWRQVIFEEQHAAAVARAAAMEATDLLKAFELKNRARAMTVQRLPFMYNGENVMLQLPYVCEWLAGVPELAAHYGSDFQWRRNPFLRGVTLDERAVTPRKATRSYKLGDEVLEEVVESLMAARREEEAALKMMQVGAEREEGGVNTRARWYCLLPLCVAVRGS